MDPRMLLSLTIVGIASATAGIGVYAFFTDSAESIDNLLDGAIVNLEIDGADAITAFISGNDVLPGECVSGSTTLTNVGTRTGSVLDLDIAIDYVMDLGSDSTGNMAAFLELTTLTYDGTALALTDSNSNGFQDLEDWDASNAPSRDLTDPGTAGKDLALEICLHTSAGDDLHGDSVTFDVDFMLGQVDAAAADLT